jgi:hypothetical protein
VRTLPRRSRVPRDRDPEGPPGQEQAGGTRTEDSVPWRCRDPHPIRERPAGTGAAGARKPVVGRARGKYDVVPDEDEGADVRSRS